MKQWMAMACLAVLAGCSSKTETGYEPRRLGDTPAIQRGYYATPFSREAREAEMEMRQGGSGLDRRPDRAPGR